MDQLILALEECDFVNEPVCAPGNVTELFVFPNIVGQINRTVFLIFLAAAIVVAVLYFAYRRPSLIPTKFQAGIESLVRLVRDDIAVGMALVTWFIFLVVGVRKQGIGYFTHLLWPPGVPVALKPLVGVIEFVSTILVRPFSLAVRLFANLVAGHTMLSLLLVTGWVFTSNLFVNFGEIGWKGLAGFAWFGMALGIWVFELMVSFLQAYIFTLLSAVYIESSLHPEH